MSGIDPSTSRSTLARTESAPRAVDLTIGGIIRFKASQLVSGLTAMSLAAPAIVLRSRIMLRPLVSVPPNAGNLASRRVVSPTWTTRLDSSPVLAARASAAGSAAAINSVTAWFLASSCSARLANSLRPVEICSDRESSVASSRLDLRMRFPNAWPWSPVALPKPLIMLVKLRIAPPLTRIAAELSTDSTVAAAVVESNPMVSPSFNIAASVPAPAGGRNATNTSPSGVAVRNSAVLPRGSRTSSVMRSLVTAV